ncbi:SAF domain-containing protein [Microbacterium sp. cx-59]|uniref:SAF domain-containing protein n=1 Tax=Microbacterium sp. cx-59 TaxID=2891207 RepID=UPI001E54AF89|nr:SAF domain-containing protein [Microbacterium sp. cx-59]MCC4909590.1 SAF domain-containing protein [Microbacterium sp. cx-59]
MTAQDPPRQRPRALWADARFVIGAALVIASIVGVWLVVAAARQTTPVFAAARTITPGEAITAGDLRVVDVALGSLEEIYLAPTQLTLDTVATRTIHAGELVPAEALGAADVAATTTVVVRSATEVPASVATGAVVEVWSAPFDAEGVREEPRILVADATVTEVTRDDSMMGGGAASVELVIPREDVADVLAAISGEASLSVVPSVGGAP